LLRVVDLFQRYGKIFFASAGPPATLRANSFVIDNVLDATGMKRLFGKSRPLCAGIFPHVALNP
jgi:hypothetical protein